MRKSLSTQTIDCLSFERPSARNFISLPKNFWSTKSTHRLPTVNSKPLRIKQAMLRPKIMFTY
jgi:hypothetical protein